MAHNHTHPGKDTHDHGHHHHDHGKPLTSVNTAFVIGIVLNFVFVVIEVVAGLINHSLSLLSDAGHNLADVASLGLSLLAFKLLRVKSNKKYTYGYRKTSILVALFNAVVLLVSIGAIIYEAVLRLMSPEPVKGGIIAVVAGIGIVINAFTALLFFRRKDSDMNIKSAYLHLMGDALVSLALVAGGLVIIYTGWFWIDSALSILVAAVILMSTWRLLRDSLRLSLDGVPAEIKLDEVKSAAMQVKGVVDFHHVHVWAISTTENALTAHMVLKENTGPEEEKTIKYEIKHALLHKNIQHTTLETERENETCAEENAIRSI
jgi:cobalt-zinc-cadmium efflux system protein